MRVLCNFVIESILSPNCFLSLDSNGYHYNLAGNRIDPQQLTRVNKIMPISLGHNAFGIGTLPNDKIVRLVDERYKNKTLNDSTRNETE